MTTTDDVHLTVRDLSGRLVRNLFDGVTLPSGTHDATWNGRDDKGAPLATGMYFYTLRTPGFQETRKMTLLK